MEDEGDVALHSSYGQSRQVRASPCQVLDGLLGYLGAVRLENSQLCSERSDRVKRG